MYILIGLLTLFVFFAHFDCVRKVLPLMFCRRIQYDLYNDTLHFVALLSQSNLFLPTTRSNRSYPFFDLVPLLRPRLRSS